MGEVLMPKIKLVYDCMLMNLLNASTNYKSTYVGACIFGYRRILIPAIYTLL